MGFAEKEAQRRNSPVKKISGVGIETKQIGRPKTGRETKVTKAITILPSIYNEAAAIAKSEYKSMSELIQDYLIEYIEQHKK